MQLCCGRVKNKDLANNYVLGLHSTAIYPVRWLVGCGGAKRSALVDRRVNAVKKDYFVRSAAGNRCYTV